MSQNIVSLSSSQLERNRYVLISRLHRSQSAEPGNHVRTSTNKETCKMNGDCQSGHSIASPSHSLESSEVANRKRRNKVTINVSGEKYQTYKETLEKFPKTLLGDPARRQQYFEDDDNEYFFDRDRHAFAAIIHFYQSDGQIYCPLNVPVHILIGEIKFFELGQDALNQALDNEGPSSPELPKNRLQREIWKLFEIPESGVAANLLTIFSVLIIISSVSILCIETLPYFKGTNPMPNLPKLGHNRFGHCSSAHQSMFGSPHLPHPMQQHNNSSTDQEHSKEKSNQNRMKGTDWLKIFELCETGIVAWFSLEFLTRFFSCPNKLEFIKSYMNIIDLLAILPYYITLIFDKEGLGLDNIRMIRLVRVLRIFKLSRHSRGLQILGLTLRASIRELGLLIFFLLIGIILFSSAIYYVEEETFQSIPDAFWWAIITMCTVGYGDKVPDTFYGKLVGSLCAVCGVLTIALPVPVIVSNFDYFYQRERARRFNQILAADDIDTTSTVSENDYTTLSSDFRRQEQIEQQKRLKRLQGQSQHVRKLLKCNANGNGKVNGCTIQIIDHIERESVV